MRSVICLAVAVLHELITVKEKVVQFYETVKFYPLERHLKTTKSLNRLKTKEEFAILCIKNSVLYRNDIVKESGHFEKASKYVILKKLILYTTEKKATIS